MDLIRKRTSSEVLKRGYSDAEIDHIYALGRMFLENGDLRKAEAIMHGLGEVAPDFAPAFLALAYIQYHHKAIDDGVKLARHALKLDQKCVEAALFLIAGLMTVGDLQSAGTYLGEIGDQIEAGQIEDPKCLRFYKAQLARYQSK